jgi:catalase
MYATLDLVGNNTLGFFLRDPLKFSGFESCGETRPAHQFSQREKQLGFLDVAAGSLAPG